MTIPDPDDGWVPFGYTEGGFAMDEHGVFLDTPAPPLPSGVALGRGELFTGGTYVGRLTQTTPVGLLRQCQVCVAPIVDPFPDDWELELIKEGPAQGPVDTFYTPHRPGCAAPYADPDPGIAVRVPGRYVTDLRISLGGVELT